MGKKIVGAIVVLSIALAAFYFNPNLTIWSLDHLTHHAQWLQEVKESFWGPPDAASSQQSQSANLPKSEGRCTPPEELLFTKEALKRYDGNGEGEAIMLAFLGRVYDVSKGSQHYRPGGGYSFFAGIDGCRAFVSGDFTPAGLTDNLRGLDVENFGDVLTWLKFYDDEYELVGRLVGRYYDPDGCPTQELAWVEGMIVEYEALKAAAQEEDIRFPHCNSEWTAATKSGRVWCSTRSGGTERDWVGVPRQLFSTSDPKRRPRCACVRNSGPPSLVPGLEYADEEDEDSPPPSSSHRQDGDLGDLGNPRLKEYPDCEPNAVECPIRD